MTLQCLNDVDVSTNSGVTFLEALVKYSVRFELETAGSNPLKGELVFNENPITSSSGKSNMSQEIKLKITKKAWNNPESGKAGDGTLRRDLFREDVTDSTLDLNNLYDDNRNIENMSVDFLENMKLREIFDSTKIKTAVGAQGLSADQINIFFNKLDDKKIDERSEENKTGILYPDTDLKTLEKFGLKSMLVEQQVSRSLSDFSFESKLKDDQI